MATLSLVRGATTVSLIDGTDGIYLARNGWNQAVSHNERGVVSETITLDAEGSSATNLASRFNAVSSMIRQMKARNRDPVAPDPTYLRALLDGMTTTRQAYVVNMEAALNNTLYSPPTATYHTIPRWTLAVERHPWENTSTSGLDTNVPNGTNQPIVGTPAGTLPGRIWRTRIQTSGSFTDMWWGFRTNRYGSQANFVPTWPLTQGTALNTATDDGTDIVYAGGDTDMLMRARIEMSQVSAIGSNYSDQRGRFLVLLAASLTHTSSTYYVKLADGFRNSANWYVRDPIEIDGALVGTSLQVYPMGTVSIPPAGLRGANDSEIDNLLQDYALALYAQEATDGSGSLKMRYLILIPQSEGACAVRGLAVANASSTFGAIYTDVDGRYSAYSTDTSSVTNSPDDFQVTDYYMPTEVFSVAFVGTHNTSGYNTARVGVLSFNYYPRWAALAP